MKTKLCTKCNRVLPADIATFGIHSGNKDNLQYWCKQCRKEYGQSHRPECNERSRLSRLNNYEASLERERIFRETNRERLRAKSREYRANNKEKYLEECRLWRINNKEKRAATCSKYTKSHPEQNRRNTQKRHSRKRNLLATLTLFEWDAIKSHFDNKCAYCGEEKKLEQEHFIAITKGGEYTHNNIIPCCINCNRSKLNRDFFDWYPKFKHYSKSREQKILKFLNYNGTQQQLKLFI